MNYRSVIKSHCCCFVTSLVQSRAGSYEEKYNELIAARKKDQDLFSNAQQKCHEATQKLEAQNAELNGKPSSLYGRVTVVSRSTNVGFATQSRYLPF